MVQKEVGNEYDVDVKNGSSFLSIYLAQFWTVEDRIIVPSMAFYPAPKVDGLVLVLAPTYEPNFKLIKFVRVGFGTPRKKLGNVLNLDTDNVYYDKRAHQLSLEDWKNLFDLLHKIG
jgi:16S rRNA A1518/A1519 N6-dimethyltransferase RsmA/KsgA/DIM1 with predicted DNA glycosylase/AP lyase activity